MICAVCVVCDACVVPRQATRAVAMQGYSNSQVSRAQQTRELGSISLTAHPAPYAGPELRTRGAAVRFGSVVLIIGIVSGSDSSKVLGVLGRLIRTGIATTVRCACFVGEKTCSLPHSSTPPSGYASGL